VIKIKQIQLNGANRVIVISDIHGDLVLLKRLLNKVNYTEEDTLIINGDLCEKGSDSLGVIRYIIQLCNQNEKVYVTKGNNDILIDYICADSEWIFPYLKRVANSVIHEMVSKHGKSITDFSTKEELSAFCHEHFKEECEWLSNLPAAYESEKYIFIHAGIANIERWQETDLQTALAAKAFYEQGHQSSKIVVVGHWPTCNYAAKEVSHNNSLIDLQKRIICTDGGNQLKTDGQLNALIIYPTVTLSEDTYCNVYVDHFIETTVINPSIIEVEEKVGNITYPNYELRILEEGEYFTLCENINLQTKQWVKNEYIVERDGTYFAKDDVSTTMLTVNTGDTVAIIDDECEGYTLVKKDGQVGWIRKECIVKGVEIDSGKEVVV
jgi:protein phosphatase